MLSTPEVELVAAKRGTKVCRGCGERITGLRTRVCPLCHNPFPIKQKGDYENNSVINTNILHNYPVISQLPGDYADKGIHTIIVTPTVPCPVDVPTQFKYIDIVNWVENVRAKGADVGEFFAVSALMAFGKGYLKGADYRRFVDIVTSEAQDAAPFVPSEEVE